MPATPDLQPHDIITSQQTRFDQQGNAVRVTLVTYWIGNHGPFQLEYPAGGGGADQVKSDITSHVAELRRLLQIQEQTY